MFQERLKRKKKHAIKKRKKRYDPRKKTHFRPRQNKINKRKHAYLFIHWYMQHIFTTDLFPHIQGLLNKCNVFFFVFSEMPALKNRVKQVINV